MRTSPPRSKFRQFSGIYADPVSDRLLNNPACLSKGYQFEFDRDLSFRFSKILWFGLQRFCSCLNLAYQIS